MSGLILLAIIGLFVAVLNFFRKWLFRFFDHRLDTHKIRSVANVIFWVLAFTLPISDDIIGGFQFRELCKNGSMLKIDAEKIKGKTVRVVIDPSNEYVSDTITPIRFSHFSYRDVETNEEYASFSRYYAEAGWLLRSYGMPGSELLTAASSCSPPRFGELHKQYEFSLIN
ncbi:MAG: hypothetical protein LBU53_03385 [Zoogloeaceae bacterium]|jgi:hypothetical protein|nr:hypothetical protein [Zoogloeaceae bacterium]